MINNLTPKSTQSLYKGAETSRQKQVDAYAKDRHHNQSQMDSLRKTQYRKQADAVKSQKSHMANNAAKSSRMVTGSSMYNKEGKTFDQFTEFMLEGGRPENPEDAEYLKKNPKPNFSGEKREEKKEKGGALALRKGSGLKAPEKKEKEDDVIDVEVKDVPKSEKKEKKEKKPKALPGTSDLDKEKIRASKEKGALDREKFEYAKTQAEKRKQEAEERRKRAARRKRGNAFKNVLGKVKGGLKKAGQAASYIDKQGQGQGPSSPGPGSVQHNVAQYSK